MRIWIRYAFGYISNEANQIERHDDFFLTLSWNALKIDDFSLFCSIVSVLFWFRICIYLFELGIYLENISIRFDYSTNPINFSFYRRTHNKGLLVVA